MDTSLQSVGDLAINQANTAALKPSAMANIDKAAENFEGMFMTQMLQPMFEGLDVDGTFGGGHGEQMMRSFMVQEYGKIMAKQGGLGIGDAVKKELIKIQQQAASKHAAATATAYQAAGQYANSSSQGDINAAQ